MRYTDAKLVETISESLSKYQKKLIELVNSGQSEEQSIVPTVTLTFAEIRKLTHRTKIRTALIDKLVGLLTDEGLEVEVEPDQLVITMPPEDLPTEFESVKELLRAVKEIEKDAVAA